MHDHSKRKDLGSARLKVEHKGNKHELYFVSKLIGKCLNKFPTGLGYFWVQHVTIPIFYIYKFGHRSLWPENNYLKSDLITHQYKVAGSAPRLSSTSKVLVWVSNTRMSVPCGSTARIKHMCIKQNWNKETMKTAQTPTFTEAVATWVPCWLMAKHASSPWCALIVNGAVDVSGCLFVRSWWVRRGQEPKSI